MACMWYSWFIAEMSTLRLYFNLGFASVELALHYIHVCSEIIRCCIDEVFQPLCL